jgi:uncharacterized protein
MQPEKQSVDCDVHVQVPDISALLPYFDEVWREMIEIRGIDGFESLNYPPNSPLSCRQDWRDAGVPGEPIGGDCATISKRVLDDRGVNLGILNCLYGVQAIHDDYMAAAFARAVNDWLVDHWLAKEPRFRASIVVPIQNPQLAVEEIERRAADPRFVQVLVLASGDMPLGRSMYWPVYAAAEKHNLPIGIHAGSAYRQALTCNGWPSFHVEAYVDQAQAFQAQIASLVTHGVFRKFPALKVVLLESGVSWLPAFLWRMAKFWNGARLEAPWIDRSPAEIVREHFSLTIQPFDVPPNEEIVQKIVEHLGSDSILLYGSDYPHWHFDGDQVVPQGIPKELADKIFSENPLKTYERIRGAQ